jgi:electron transfer flavoprotein-quinone oxidoreductase
MSEEKFEVIIVGGGVAGAAAAYTLAKAGVEVVLIERGEYPGSKNLSGGILYGRVLHEMIPNYWEEAPVERHITNQIVTFLTGDSSLSLDFKTQTFNRPPYNGFSVLRSKFDRWLAEKAEGAGAMVITGIKVDQLLQKGGVIVGIAAGGEEMLANVVIAADGANSFLAQQAGLRGHIPNKHLAVGVKALIGLSESQVEERFNLKDGEGSAYAVVGDASHGIAGGGFIYTNRESLSVGVVLRLDSLLKSEISSAQVLDNFLANPFVEPLVRDGKLIEYGAHLVPEGGIEMIPRLFTDGLLVVGDAAGFTINSGLVVRGMDLAIGSGIAAAQTIIEARQAGDYRARMLSAYLGLLEKSFVFKDLKIYGRTPGFMESDRLYTTYPEFVNNFMKDQFTFDTSSKGHLFTTALKAMKSTGISIPKAALDGWKGIRAL